ncbi:F0F1 ATP synthase subunit A [candidate division GN15 bacterium]|nr:F0F1 ATP synthase subunit A [candidate division GN15 bacterium]
MIGVVLYRLALIAPQWLPTMFALVTGSADDGHGSADHGDAHGGHVAAAEHDDGHGDDHGGGPPHLPSLISLVFGHGDLYHWSDPIYALATSFLMVIVAMTVYSKRKMIPGPAQNFLEMLVEGMYNFFVGILGKDAARRYTPFLGTLFFYILINNLWGLIPGGHSPSTSINVTGTLAISVFFYAQAIGIRRLGFVGWLDHLAGSPRDFIGWVLVIIMFPLHIIGELAKPLSLALRLFGNITGEDVLVAAFVGLGLTALAFIGSPIGLPLNIPFIFLGTLLSLIQALVFTLLSSIYILMMLPHAEHH